uniref:Uncharacterized protein n=1 Tax=Anguilla anguilla TaxID=7936 RepID=A0A0E9Q1P2_ANGAN
MNPSRRISRSRGKKAGSYPHGIPFSDIVKRSTEQKIF